MILPVVAEVRYNPTNDAKLHDKARHFLLRSLSHDVSYKHTILGGVQLPLGAGGG